MVYPTVPNQRCVFHKVQNIAEHLRDRSHRQAILDQAGAIYHELHSRRQAALRLQRPSDRHQRLRRPHQNALPEGKAPRKAKTTTQSAIPYPL